MNVFRNSLWVVSAGSLMLLPGEALGCATCFGKSDDLMAKGMNMGIFTLLLVILSVLIGIASVGFYFVRRAARMSAAGSVNSPSDSQLLSHSNQ